MADVATIAILQHRAALEAQILNEQLNYALNSRIVIEQAKGMVAERENLNMEQAFSMLRNHARNHNLRLVDVARDIITAKLAVAALDRPAARPVLSAPRPRVVLVAGQRNGPQTLRARARKETTEIGFRRRPRLRYKESSVPGVETSVSTPGTVFYGLLSRPGSNGRPESATWPDPGGPSSSFP